MADTDIDVLGVDMSKKDLAELSEWLQLPQAFTFRLIVTAAREREVKAACSIGRPYYSAKRSDGVTETRLLPYEYHVAEREQNAAQATAYTNILNMARIIQEMNEQAKEQESS